MKYFVLIMALTTVVLFFSERNKFFKILGRVLCALTVATGITLGVQVILVNELNQVEIPIHIKVLDEQNSSAEGNEIWFVGVNSNGKWYSATSLRHEGEWLEKEGRIGWNSYESELLKEITLYVKGKKQNQLELKFEGNRWRGMAEISLLDKVEKVDFYQDSDGGERIISQEMTVDIPNEVNQNLWLMICFVMVFMIIIVLFIIEKKKSENKEMQKAKEAQLRDIWADALRILSAFTIVLLHATCNIYMDMSDLSSWYPLLYINVFTAYAVPVFFMLSGAFLLRGKEIKIKTIWVKRIPRLVIPLVFWSLIYLVVNKYKWGMDVNWKSFIKIVYEPQYWHLWFMYSLIAVYIIFPILIKLKKALNKSEVIYMFLLLLIIPSGIHLINNIAKINIIIPNVGFCSAVIGLCLLGSYLYENAPKWQIKKYILVIAVFLGFHVGVLTTYFVSVTQNQPTKVFFEHGSVPVLIMAATIFLLFQSFNQSLDKLPLIWKNRISDFSSMTLGIYLVHMLFLNLVSTRTFVGITFADNSGNLFEMFSGALLYFILSIMLVNIIRKIPYLRQVV